MPSTLIFPAGSEDGDSQCVAITIIDDDNVEGEHSFTVSLQNTSSSEVIVIQANATVTIRDNGMCVKYIVPLDRVITCISVTDNLLMHSRLVV